MDAFLVVFFATFFEVFLAVFFAAMSAVTPGLPTDSLFNKGVGINRADEMHVAFASKGRKNRAENFALRAQFLRREHIARRRSHSGSTRSRGERSRRSLPALKQGENVRGNVIAPWRLAPLPPDDEVIPG
ncbi:MAG: hypothetical protein AABX89_01785 [Candidatus Thermoplasmatota archaeon]